MALNLNQDNHNNWFFVGWRWGTKPNSSDRTHR